MPRKHTTDDPNTPVLTPSDTLIAEANEIFLNGSQVRARFGGLSEPSLDRWMKEENFPQPIYINHFRYWRVSEIVAFERQHAVRRISDKHISRRRLAPIGGK